MKTDIVKARKVYRCQHCQGNIEIGEMCYKRNEGSGGKNCREYYDIRWHADKKQCKPHYHKDKCTVDCAIIMY
jgi:hypothetical protein